MRRGGDHFRGRGGPSHHVSHVTPPPLEAMVGRLETLARLLHAVGRHTTRPEELYSEIRLMYQDLTRVGPQLEATYPDVLDRVVSSMRDASAKPSLPPALRLAIFQLVELRASHWCLPPDTTNYYMQRSQLQGSEMIPDNHLALPSADALSTPEGPRGFVQEIVIKNSDSGKVMGVHGRRVHLIETLSDTIISFKKPNSTKRVLSIVGPSADSVGRAKELIEDTIRRNASPVLDFEPEEDLDEVSSMSPVDEPEYSYTIHVGGNVIRISGSHLPFVQEGKLALDEYFLQKYPHLFFPTSPSNSENELPVCSASVGTGTVDLQVFGKSKVKYDRSSLLAIERSTAEQSRPVPNFLSNLDPCIRSSIALHKRRILDVEFMDKISGGMNEKSSP